MVGLSFVQFGSVTFDWESQGQRVLAAGHRIDGHVVHGMNGDRGRGDGEFDTGEPASGEVNPGDINPGDITIDEAANARATQRDAVATVP